MQPRIECSPRYASPTQPAGRGPLRFNSVVRAAYELATSTDTIGAWLSEVAQRAAPLLSRGSGLVACRARLIDGALALDELCFVGCPERAHEWRFEVTEGRPMLRGPGIDDQIAVRREARVLDGAVLYLIAPSTRRIDVSRGERSELIEFGFHLRGALDLRSLLAAKSERRTLHETLPRLRQSPEFSTASAEQATRLWNAVADGHWSLVAQTEADGRRLVLARRKQSNAAPARPLSKRERQAAFLAIQGKSTKVIAHELGVADSTAAMLVVSAIRRLGLRSRVELTEIFGSPRVRSVNASSGVNHDEIN